MNEKFRAARERAPSPVDPCLALSRKELAELVHQWILRNRDRDTAIDEVHVGKLERGEIRWPNTDYRDALRAVLNVGADADLGFRPSRRQQRLTGPDDLGALTPVADADQRDADDLQALAVSEVHHEQTIGSYEDPNGPRPPTLSPSAGVPGVDWIAVAAADVDGIEAIELLRRVEATDTGPRTLSAIGDSIELLSRSYTHIAPMQLVRSLRRYQRYIARLLDGRATLTQRKELIRHAGWLSLLAATADIDLGYERAAAANFKTARSLAAETGDMSLAAWVMETQAWEALSNGDPWHANDLCRAGLDIAPTESSAYVQLCTQLARVSARLGDARTTYRQVDESFAVLGQMSPPAQPEHHFVCDSRRVVANCAAALVWLGDGSELGEEYARQAVAQYEDTTDESGVHRLATARMNLALLLAQGGEPEEAAHLGDLAFESAWRLCNTDLFLAADLDDVLTSRYAGSPDVASFHDRYLDVRQMVGDRG